MLTQRAAGEFELSPLSLTCVTGFTTSLLVLLCYKMVGQASARLQPAQTQQPPTPSCPPGNRRNKPPFTLWSSAPSYPGRKSNRPPRRTTGDSRTTLGYYCRERPLSPRTTGPREARAERRPRLSCRPAPVSADSARSAPETERCSFHPR